MLTTFLKCLFVVYSSHTGSKQIENSFIYWEKKLALDEEVLFESCLVEELNLY